MRTTRAVFTYLPSTVEPAAFCFGATPKSSVPETQLRHDVVRQWSVMSSIRPQPTATSPEFPVLSVVSPNQLTTYGLTVENLFAAGPVAFRRVGRVTRESLVIDLGWGSATIPSLWAPTASPGQWLRFEQKNDIVLISIDVRATLRGETRLSSLFAKLTA